MKMTSKCFGRFLLYATLALLCSTCPAVFGQVSGAKPRLVPMPREIQLEQEIQLGGAVSIRSSSDLDDVFAAEDLSAELLAHGVERAPTKPGRLSIQLLRLDTTRARSVLSLRHVQFSDVMHDEGYALLSTDSTVYVIAATPTGIFYGVQTLKQLITGYGSQAALPRMKIRDWPAMKYRAQDDDLSRGPVPTLEYQKRQIRTLAAYKLNIYSPYFEHTLQYASNPLPAPPGGAMTAEDVAELVNYAARFHITVLPQQEAFGHLHHVLKHERYAHLAETPNGSVLAPGQPGSTVLIRQWFEEVAKIFPSPLVHIGADETDELGTGQTRERVAQEGLGKVYIDFLKEIHQTLLPLNKRLLFWGDIAMHSPDLVKGLPKDMIAVAWQYSMPGDGSQHFDTWIKPFTDAGIETWVAPSANRGNRIFPDNDNNLRTIQNFVADGQRLGATGMFNTVWADGGESLFAQNWYGVLFGAAASWQSGTSDIGQFEGSYGWSFHRDASGDIDKAELELSQAHLTLASTGLYAKNALFWEDPWSTTGQQDLIKILPVAHNFRMHAETAIEMIEKAKRQPNLQNRDALEAMELGARKMDFIGQKFQQAQQMIDEFNAIDRSKNDKTKHDAMVDASYIITGNNGQCQDLRDGYGLLRDLYRDAWLKENRPYWLDNVDAQYDFSMQLWIRRGSDLRDAFNLFDKTGQLASAQQFGLPPSLPNLSH